MISITPFILLTSHFSAVSKDMNLDFELFNTCDSMFTLTLIRAGRLQRQTEALVLSPVGQRRAAPLLLSHLQCGLGSEGEGGRHAGPFVPLWRAHIRGHMDRKTG